MSREMNINAVRIVIEEGFSKGDLSALDAVYAPEVIEHQVGMGSTLESVKESILFLRRAFPDLQLTIEDMVADGDKVWVRSTARGTNLGGFMGASNGKSIEITVYDSVRCDKGKIVEHWGVPDRFTLLAQLGMLEQLMPPPAPVTP